MKKFLFAIVALSIMSCSTNGVSYRDAFTITQSNKIDRSGFGFAKLQLTVRNNLELSGGCWALIKIKRNNVIIETSSLTFSHLNPNESQMEEAWFSKFDKHSEYDRAEVILQWSVDSIAYSKTYHY